MAYREEPVRRVLQPILAGELPALDPLDDDHQYVTDLGLIAPNPPVRIANPIYREIIFRVLASGAERAVLVDRRIFVMPDGQLDIERLLRGFALRWPHPGDAGQRRVQRAALELKVWRDRDKKGDPLVQGLRQLDDYLGRLGLTEGVLVIFDCRSAAPPVEERTRFEEAQTPSGRRVTVLRA